jgi:hypothetical protein
VTDGFPVLSAGPTPHTPLAEWTFSVRQGGGTLKSWTWQEFQELPAETVTADIHCVTRWSKLGTEWRGVPVATLADREGPFRQRSVRGRPGRQHGKPVGHVLPWRYPVRFVGGHGAVPPKPG